MKFAALSIIAAWATFWAYWLIASLGAKPGRTDWGRSALVRVAIVVLVLQAVRARVFRLTTMPITGDPWLQGAGVGVVLLGLGLAVWARVVLGENWGTPMSQKDEPELVTAGPYQLIRHPIYLGLIVAMVGTAVAVSWDWAIAAIVVGAYFVLSAIVEERNLVRHLPEAYARYLRSTKMLIPFIL